MPDRARANQYQADENQYTGDPSQPVGRLRIRVNEQAHPCQSQQRAEAHEPDSDG